MAIVAEPSTAETSSATRSYGRLRTLNVAVGLFLLAEAAYMVLISNKLALPVTASFFRDDPIAVRGPTIPSSVFSIRIGPSVALFLALAAIDHLVVAAPRVHRWYERGLARGVNHARWIEYSVSASIMIVLIGLFVGIRDLAAVGAIFAVNTGMILFGLLMERHQRPGNPDWSAFWFGSLIGAVPWVLIAIFITEPPDVPGFVYAITIVQLVLFCGFALNMALQYAQIGRWRDYLHGEIVYIALSVSAKSLLAWLIFANVLRS